MTEVVDLPGPPGNPGWARALAESTTAQRDPFVEAEERLRGLTPSHWSGPAHDGFLAARDRLVEEWRSTSEIHDAVSRRIDGHNQYVHELQHVWEADRGNRAAQWHSEEVYRAAVSSLAEELVRRAAELDAVARTPARAVPEPGPEQPSESVTEPEREPDSRPVPTPVREAVPHPVPASDATPWSAPEAGPEPEARPDREIGPEPVEDRDQPPGSDGVDPPAHADGQVFFQARRQVVARLEEELLAGEHLTRIKWLADPAA